MAYKLYINANILYLNDNDNDILYEGIARDCLHRRTSLNSTKFAFTGMNNWSRQTEIEFSDIQDKDGNPISNTYATAQLLSDYLDGVVGKSSPQASGQSGLDELGWSSFADTVSTELAPLVVLDGQTATLVNNANIIIDDNSPIGGLPLFDQLTNKIKPKKLGDYLIKSIRFLAKSTAKESYLEFYLDIGAPVLPNFPLGFIFPDTVTFPKGANISHPINIISHGYAGAVYLLNGGIPKIKAVGGNVSIYNIEFQIAVVNKGKL